IVEHSSPVVLLNYAYPASILTASPSLHDALPIFYGESGGQVGDVGMMIGEGVRARVTDTHKKAGDLFVHSVTVEEGTLTPGTALDRKSTRLNSSHVKISYAVFCLKKKKENQGEEV